jgi:hypothetical protein
MRNRIAGVLSCTQALPGRQALILDRQADFELSVGRYAEAERLSRLAEELREAGH